MAGLWLAVLGVTGFILDHREWAWLWQTGVSARWLPARIAEPAAQHAVRLYRIAGDGRRLAGGLAGLWHSVDDGRHWQPVTDPQGRRLPPVHQLLRGEGGWWLATADGMWRLAEGKTVATPFALSGRAVTALAPRDRSRLWAVIDRSELVSLEWRRGDVTPFPLPAVPAPSLPAAIDLSRLVHDLHFGRGLFSAPWSLWWSDAAGIGMVLLPLGGFLYWWLPRRFRARRRAGRVLDGALHRSWIRWLYRTHAPTTGLLVVVPLIYLAATGILLDHAAALRPWMKSVSLPQFALPPVYGRPRWRGEIRAVVGWPQTPDRVSLGTRLGLFTVEAGRVHRELLAGGRAVFVWMAWQDADAIVLGGMGGPNHRWQSGRWLPQPHGAHMPTDVTRDGQGRLLWKTREGLRLREGDGFRTVAAGLPDLGYVPWYAVIDGLHSGLLIHPGWRWVNDAVALLALLLVGTGLWRWWRVKWI